MKNPHAQALGALGGKSTSEAKKKAVRENGKKGGRPRVVSFMWRGEKLTGKVVARGIPTPNSLLVSIPRNKYSSVKDQYAIHQDDVL